MRYGQAINIALFELMEANPKLIMLGEDLLDPYGGAFKISKGLSSRFPDQVISTPISEAAFTGLGIGLSVKGHQVVVEIMFGDFITLAVDQIVNGLSKIVDMYGDHVCLPLVIRAPMGGRRGYGPTHSQSLESMFLSVPNIEIYAPSVFHNPGSLLKRTLESAQPTIFVENKILYPKTLFSDGDGNFQIRQDEASNSVLISYDLEGESSCLLISYGGMASLALEACQQAFLEDEQIVDLLVVANLKLQRSSFIDFIDLGKYSKVVIAEEGVAGIWGALTFRQIQPCLSTDCVVDFVHARDNSIPSAPKLEYQNLPQIEDLLEAVRR